MKKIIGGFKNKNLWVYIFSFSAIILFIVLIMGSYLCWFYYRTIYADFENSNEEYLNGVMSRHEYDMQILEDIQTQISLAGSKVEFVLRENPKKNFDLRDMLYQYTSVSQFFDRMFFFYHKDQYLYNHATSISVSDFVNAGLCLEYTSSERFKDLLYEEEERFNILPEQSVSGRCMEKLGAVIEQAAIYISTIEPKRSSTVLFVVGSSYYDKLLMDDIKNMRHIFIFYDDMLVTHRGFLGTEEGKRFGENLSFWEEESPREIIENHEKYLLTWSQGESGLVYCSIQSVEIFQNKMLMGQWGILLLLSICSIPTSLLVYVLSKSLSGKVRSINGLLGEEAYNLEGLENGVRILLESKKRSNHESLFLRKTRFISRFVRGRFETKEEIISAAIEASIQVNKAYYSVALIGDIGNNKENETHKKMLDRIMNCPDIDGYGIHLISNNQSLYVVFGNSKEGIREIWEKLFYIGKNDCEEFIMAVSYVHEDLMGITNAYLEADAAYATRLLVDNSRIIYYGDVRLNEKEMVLSDKYLQRLKNAIRAGEKTEVQKVIQEICNNLRLENQSLLTFRMFCNEIIHMMLTESSTNQAEYDDIYNVFALSQCQTIQDFNDILREVSSNLMERRIEHLGNGSDFVNRAVQYMKEEYQNPDFNMGMLAEYLEISGVTLAVKFKNIMEISPSEYLMILRMEQAKSLLRETNMQVKIISMEVGYEDSRVFMHRFKKYTGKTPMQYRKGE
ncbi:AraC family transcriptional regulator [Lachnospiraceae bacterium OttesenSCG-928-D06]|nr:AraC family transcriptional regulator [Lachnospiraceae bacterium OttesenSCG-928-D06]